MKSFFNRGKKPEWDKQLTDALLLAVVTILVIGSLLYSFFGGHSSKQTPGADVLLDQLNSADNNGSGKGDAELSIAGREQEETEAFKVDETEDESGKETEEELRPEAETEVKPETEPDTGADVQPETEEETEMATEAETKKEKKDQVELSISPRESDSAAENETETGAEEQETEVLISGPVSRA